MPRRVRCPHCQTASSIAVVWSVGGRCPRCHEALDPPTARALTPTRSTHLRTVPAAVAAARRVPRPYS